MTTFEHALVGVNAVLASGLQRRYGWQLAALAGLAAIAPDWDGLTLLHSAELFDRSHRVWGHNLLACVLLGTAIGLLDHRFDLITRMRRGIGRGVTLPPAAVMPPASGSRTLGVWIAVAILGCLSQLPCDMVVSGTQTLGDWHLQILWPFSTRKDVYPLIEWGDAGMTLLFIAGLFALLRWPAQQQLVAAGTLTAVAAYIAL